MATTALTQSQITSGLLSDGRGLSSGQFTYSIPAAGAAWPGYSDTGEPATFTPLSSTQAMRFTAAIQEWDKLIAPDFVQTDDATAPGVIRVAFTNHADIQDNWGYAFVSRTSTTLSTKAADIWINEDQRNGGFAANSYDFASTIHEIGHALGLKHSFEGVLIPEPYENQRYTVMSYDNPVGEYQVMFDTSSGSIRARYLQVEPSTPMVLDIAAAQAKYGAEPDTAPGNDTYSFDPSQAFLKAIYDAGGVDTLDASRFTRASDIDLTPGAYSSLGLYSVEAQIADWTAANPVYASYVRQAFAQVSPYAGKENLGIAFSTLIENAVGGAGDDSITGNIGWNGLYGGAGRDYMRGLDGDDWVEGQAGNDDVNGNAGLDVVHGSEGADWVRGGRDNDQVYGDAGDDPHVNGNIGEDAVFGGLGNDTVFGGQGADTLYGEDGDDWLSGDLGADLLVGGAGADRFLIRAGAGADSVADFNSAQGDRVQLTPGSAYSLISAGSSMIVDLGNGDSLTLSGVSQSQMGDWLVFA